MTEAKQAPIDIFGRPPTLADMLEDLISELERVQLRLELMSDIVDAGPEARRLDVNPVALFSVMDDSATDCRRIGLGLNGLVSRAMEESEKLKSLEQALRDSKAPTASSQRTARA